MQLFEEIEVKDVGQNPVLQFRENREPPIIVKEEIKEVPHAERLSTLSQYFLAPFIFVSTNGILEIPIFHKEIEERILQELAPHFNKVTKIKIDNETQIKLQDIKDHSKLLFKKKVDNGKLNAIVSNIYSQGSIGGEGNFTIKMYKVNLHLVQKLNDYDILSIWDFFKHSIVRAYGGFVILPMGWSFDDTFKERIAIQCFANVCNSMTVVVNENNNMISSVILS